MSETNDWRDHPAWRNLAIARSILTLAVLIALVVTGLGFESATQGFVAANKSVFRCHDLMSSGSDDDAFPGTLLLFAAPALVLRVLRFRRGISFLERVTFLCPLIVWFVLQTMDCASLATTYEAGDRATVRLVNLLTAAVLLYLLPNLPPMRWSTIKRWLQAAFW